MLYDDAPLETHAAYLESCLPTFQDKVCTVSSRDEQSSDHQPTPRNVKHEQSSEEHRGRSLRSHIMLLVSKYFYCSSGP